MADWPRATVLSATRTALEASMQASTQRVRMRPRLSLRLTVPRSYVGRPSPVLGVLTMPCPSARLITTPWTLVCASGQDASPAMGRRAEDMRAHVICTPCRLASKDPSAYCTRYCILFAAQSRPVIPSHRAQRALVRRGPARAARWRDPRSCSRDQHGTASQVPRPRHSVESRV